MPNVSKVIYEDEVLIDLTSDTVHEGNLLAGATAHSRDGDVITGMVEIESGEIIRPAFSVNNEILILVPGTGNNDRIVFGPIG